MAIFEKQDYAKKRQEIESQESLRKYTNHSVTGTVYYMCEYLIYVYVMPYICILNLFEVL